LGAISRFESEFQNGINAAFNKEYVDMFKALRMQLPYTKSKMNWTNISSHKLFGSLGQK
jgi:hypothetical protein